MLTDQPVCWFFLSCMQHAASGYPWRRSTSARIRRDPNIYENPDVFDGIRFAKTKGNGTDVPSSLVYSMTKTAPEFHVFGHGKHAW